MKKPIVLFLAITVLISLGTLGEAQAFRLITQEMVEKELIVETDLIQTADNFIILFDTSGSSNQMVPGKNISKIQAAKSLLKERNAWFPNLGFKAGLYIYTDNQTLTGTFKEVYGMQDYDRERFAAAIDQLPEKGQGSTTLNAGLHPLRKVLAGLSGKTAVIMFTDGQFSRAKGAKRPLQIVQEIAQDHDVCFYLISSATADVEKQLLDAVSTINACSRVIPMAAFMDNPTYLSGALFTVKTTAYERLVPTTRVVGFEANDMLFDFNSATVRGEYTDKLAMLGDYLQNNPDAFVVAAGFADSVGDEEYNLALSERRASSFKDHLVNNYSIDANRIVTLWYGELNPVADNATEEGRQLNRRVEVAVGVGGVN
jgi:OOP family OmpA-OmpF porin